MGYTDHDWSDADATGAFPALDRPGTDGVRYADSGWLPDDALLTDDVRLAGARPLADGTRVAGGSRVPDGSRVAGGARVAHGLEIAHEGPLMDASRHARGNGLTDGGRLANSGGHTGGRHSCGWLSGDAFPDGGASPGGGFQRGGRELDADTGVYPVDDWYAGYEQYAREQDDRPGQPSAAAAGEQPLIRAYARPADPREAPGSAGEWPAASQPPGDTRRTGTWRTGTRAGRRWRAIPLGLRWPGGRPAGRAARQVAARTGG